MKCGQFMSYDKRKDVIKIFHKNCDLKTSKVLILEQLKAIRKIKTHFFLSPPPPPKYEKVENLEEGGINPKYKEGENLGGHFQPNLEI